MSTMLAPLVENYYARQVHPKYIQAMAEVKQVTDQLAPDGMVRNTILSQVRRVVEGLEKSEHMTNIGMTLGTEMNSPTRQEIDRLANLVQRYPGGPQAAAELKAVSNLISHRRISEELFK